MTKARSIAAPPETEAPEAASAATPAAVAGIPRVCEEPLASGFLVASHDILFAAKRESRCDACGAEFPSDEDADADDYGVAGRGVYLWARGGEITLEHAPLCRSCASAIGMTALARWEIEEEEG